MNSDKMTEVEDSSKKNSKSGTSISNVFIWQFLSQFFLAGVSIITMPVFTRLLSTEEYGKFTNYNSWVVFIGVVAGLQTAGTIANAKVKYKEEDYQKYLSSIVALTSISYTVVLVISVIFRDPISALTLVNPDLVNVMVIYSFSMYMMTLYSQVLMMNKEAKKNALIALLNSVLTVALSIVLVLMLNHDKEYGRVYGTLIPTAAIAFVEAFLIIKKGRVVYAPDFWKYCLNLSIPLIFHSLAGTVLSLSDRVMLTRIDGEEATAIYTVVYSIGAMVNILWTVYNTTWVPFYYQYKKNHEVANIHAKLKNYILTYTLLVGIFVLCIQEIFKFLIPEIYWVGINMIPIVVVGYYFNFMYAIYVNFEFYHEQTKIISVGTIMAAVVNIILNQILIVKYGSIGAAFATAISYGLLFVFHYLASRFLVKETCEIGLKRLIPGFLGMMCIVAAWVALKEFWVVRWLLAAGLGIILVKRVVSQKSIF